MFKKSRNVNRYSIAVFLVLLSLLVCNISFAAIPRYLSVQAKVTDSDGELLDDSYTVTFRVYSAVTGGTALWSEIQTIAISGGILDAVIGTTTAFPSSMTFNTDYWLSIDVNSDGEMSPRIRLTCSPYALNADEIDDIDSLQIVRNDTDNTIDGYLIINGDTTLGDASSDSFTINAATISLGNAATLDLADSSTTALNIESGLLNLDTSNARVGIGTTDPYVLLDLGAAVDARKLALYNAAGGGDFYGFGMAGGMMNVYVQDAGSDAPVMTFEAGDNVGIGTTNPACALDIGGGTRNLVDGAGDLLVSADLEVDDQVRIDGVNQSGRGADILTLTGTLNKFDGGGDIFSGDIFRGIYIDYTNAGHTGDPATDFFYGMDIADISGVAEATETAINIGTGWDNAIVANSQVALGTVSTTTGSLVFNNANNEFSTTFLTNDSAGESVTYTLPKTSGTEGQGLQTDGAGALRWATFLTGETGDISAVTAGSGLTGGGTSGAVTLNVGAGTGITVNANDIAVNAAGIGTTTWGAGSNFTWTFDAGTTDPAITFDTGGYIGIGTTDPSTALEVIGTVTADGLTMGQDENITLSGETIDHDGTDFEFSDNIDTVGSVELGSSLYWNPGAGVRGKIDWTPLTTDKTVTIPNATGNMCLDSIDNTFTTGQTVTGTVTADGLTMDNAEVLTIGTNTITTNGGNTLFNVTGSPQGFNAIGDADVFFRIKAGSGTYDAGLVFFDVTTAKYYIGYDDSASDSLVIGTGGTVGTNPIMTIESGGDIGIGTTNPGTALEVIGTVTADGLTLGQDENITLGAQTLDHDGTDFVFNDRVKGVGFIDSGATSGDREGLGITVPIPSTTGKYTFGFQLETGGTEYGMDFETQPAAQGRIGTRAGATRYWYSQVLGANVGDMSATDGTRSILFDASAGSFDLTDGTDTISLATGTNAWLSATDGTTTTKYSADFGVRVTAGTTAGFFGIADNDTDAGIALRTNLGDGADENGYAFTDLDGVVAHQLQLDGDVVHTGNVGIGTTDPKDALDIIGGVAIGSLAVGVTAPANGLVVQGNVGIGDYNPSYKLSVEGGDIAIQATEKVILDSNLNGDSYLTYDSGNSWVEVWVDNNEGARFTSGGGLSLDAHSGTGPACIVLFDIAEEIPVLGEDIEGGDVVVIDEDNDITVRKSTTAYDTKVAGVISTTPAYLIEVFNDESYGEPLALAGRVRCKVDASYGEIKRGDLLTTSPVPGHAMKFELLDVDNANNFEELKEINKENDRRRRSVLGKALEPLESGRRQIMVLVTLQ